MFQMGKMNVLRSPAQTDRFQNQPNHPSLRRWRMFDGFLGPALHVGGRGAVDTLGLAAENRMQTHILG